MLRTTSDSQCQALVKFLKSLTSLPRNRQEAFQFAMTLSEDLNQDFINIPDFIETTFGNLPAAYHENEPQALNGTMQQLAYNRSLHHPDYNILAGRFLLASLYLQTRGTFEESVRALHHENPSLLRAAYVDFCCKHGSVLETWLEYDHDVRRPYNSLKSIHKMYLARARPHSPPAERPQYCILRAAIDTHLDRLGQEDEATVMSDMENTYRALARGYFVFATPILINSGHQENSKSSCFLMAPEEDSTEGMTNMFRQASCISKSCGGIGFTMDLFRAKDSLIRKSGGRTHGAVPFFQVMESVARLFDQGGGRRNGSFAAYIPVWHADIFQCLEAMRLHGEAKLRCPDLFFGVWVCDEFMKRAYAETEEERRWPLFSPDDTPELPHHFGKEFEALFRAYEAEGVARTTVDAAVLLNTIIERIAERGFPYVLFSDTCNKKNNQKHIGCLRTSNLCAEILEFCGRDAQGRTEIAACNLASINLSAFLGSDPDGTPTFDFDTFRKTCHLVVRDMNHIIDHQEYPVLEAKFSNLRHRPLGIGLQGLQNLFFHFNIPYDSKEAKIWNSLVYEHLYYNCLEASCDLACQNGHPYPTYEGSEFSKGRFQFDMWDEEGVSELPPQTLDWEALRQKIRQHGVYNSLLTAQMPTVSTSQFLCNVESMEAIFSLVERIDAISNEFLVVNRELVETLCRLGLWSYERGQRINMKEGSIQDMKDLPEQVRNVYKTRLEIKQVNVLEHATGRGRYLDQTQSQNYLFGGSVEENLKKFRALFRMAWKQGHKTGSYYIRTKAAHNHERHVQKQLAAKKSSEENGTSTSSCQLRRGENGETCLSCSA